MPNPAPARAFAGSVLGAASSAGQSVTGFAAHLARSARNSIVMRISSISTDASSGDDVLHPAHLQLLEATLGQVEKLVEEREGVKGHAGFDAQLVCVSCGVLAALCYTTTRGMCLRACGCLRVIARARVCVYVVASKCRRSFFPSVVALPGDNSGKKKISLGRGAVILKRRPEPNAKSRTHRHLEAVYVGVPCAWEHGRSGCGGTVGFLSKVYP